MFGKEATEEFEVTGFEPPGRIGLRVDGSKGASGKGEFLFQYRLTPNGSGTKVHMDGEIRMPGWFSSLMGKLMVGAFRKACDRDMGALKMWLEQGVEA
jgi:carbon monoxide dehydrogenase subunit G